MARAEEGTGSCAHEGQEAEETQSQEDEEAKQEHGLRILQRRDASDRGQGEAGRTQSMIQGRLRCAGMDRSSVVVCSRSPP